MCIRDRSKDIQVIADADIPVKLNSSEIDLCCIIGNLFDNAIEASLQLPKEKRLIRIYMDMKNTQLYISFTNFTAVSYTHLDVYKRQLPFSSGIIVFMICPLFPEAIRSACFSVR